MAKKIEDYPDANLAYQIDKAQQRVIRAAKRWLKAWKSGEITQAEPKTFIDEQDHPADTKLAKAVDDLLKIEKKQ